MTVDFMLRAAGASSDVTQAESGWSACAAEDQYWSMAARADECRLYRPTVVPKIATRAVPALRGHVASMVTEAANSLIRFDGSLSVLGTLERSSIRLAITYAEAAASARLDGIVGSSPAAFSYAMLTGGDDAVVRGARSVLSSLDASSTASSIHAELFEGRPYAAGRWREHQIWTGPRGSTPPTAVYVPPRHERVPESMADLDEFCGDTMGQPIAVAALAYAQFCAISPYVDGNGRAGRALVSSLMARWGVARELPTPLSMGLIRSGISHDCALEAFRQGDPLVAIETVAEAIVAGVTAANDLVERLAAELRDAADRLKTCGTRADSFAWPMLSYLLGQPVMTTGRAGRAVGTDRASGYKAAGRLAEAGVVVPYMAPNPKPVWQAPGVLKVWAGRVEADASGAAHSVDQSGRQ